MRTDILIYLLLATAATVTGAVIEWTGASGVNSDFATAANWSPAQVPGSDDSILVHSGDSIRITANVLFESLVLESTDRDSPAAAFIADSPTAFSVSVGSLNVTSGRIEIQATLGIRSSCAVTDGHIATQTITVTGSNQYCYLSGNVTFNAPHWQVDGTLVLATVSSRTGLDTFVRGVGGNGQHSATARVVFLSTGAAPAVGATLSVPPYTAQVDGTIEMSALGQRLLITSGTATVSATWTNPALSTLEARAAGLNTFNFGAGNNNVPQTLIIAELCEITTTGGGAVGLNFGVVELSGNLQLPVDNPTAATYHFQELRVTTSRVTDKSVIGSLQGSLGGPLLRLSVAKFVTRRMLELSCVAFTADTSDLSFPLFLALGSTWTHPISAQATLSRQFALLQSNTGSAVTWSGAVVITNQSYVDLQGAHVASVGSRTAEGVVLNPNGAFTISGTVTLLDGVTSTVRGSPITLSNTAYVNCSTPQTLFRVRGGSQTWQSTSAVVGHGWLAIEGTSAGSAIDFLQTPTVRVPPNLMLTRVSLTFVSAVTLNTLEMVHGSSLSLRQSLTVDTITVRGNSFSTTIEGPSKPALKSDFGCSDSSSNAIAVTTRQMFVRLNLTREDRLELSRVLLTITEHTEMSANMLLDCGSRLTIASTASAIFAPFSVVASDRPIIPRLTFQSGVLSPPNAIMNLGTSTFGAGAGAPVNAYIDLGLGGYWHNKGSASMFTIGGGGTQSAVTVVAPSCFFSDAGAIVANPPAYNSALCNVSIPEPPSSSTGGSWSSSTGTQTSGAVHLLNRPHAVMVWSLAISFVVCLLSASTAPSF